MIWENDLQKVFKVKVSCARRHLPSLGTLSPLPEWQDIVKTSEEILALQWMAGFSRIPPSLRPPCTLHNAFCLLFCNKTTVPEDDWIPTVGVCCLEVLSPRKTSLKRVRAPSARTNGGKGRQPIAAQV